MTEFFTLIAFGPLGVPTSDTDYNTNSHRSVRSYKTEAVARNAYERSTQTKLNVTHRILKTTVHHDGRVTTKWIDL